MVFVDAIATQRKGRENNHAVWLHKLDDALYCALDYLQYHVIQAFSSLGGQ